MGHPGQTGMSSQMLSLLNNHASAMSKIKSNLLDNLLQRKLPKFNNGASSQQQQSDIASMAAAVVAATMGHQNSALLSPDAESMSSKTNHLNKLLQNIADMNHLHHATSANVASLASSSPSSSSASSSSSESHDKSNLFLNNSSHNNGSQLNSELADLNDSEFMEKQQHKDWDGDEADEELDEEESNPDGISDDKNEVYYDEDLDEDQCESSNKQAHLIDDECEENDLRSRSPSNSSKSSGCSSMSSLIQSQFLNQQKQQQQHQHQKHLAGGNNGSASAANKLFMSHLAGCITPPISQLTIENHLKNFQQQQAQRQQHLMQQPHYQPHGNYNSYNTNGVKRKKSKEFAAMNSFIPSVGAMNCIRSGKQSPLDVNGASEQANHMVSFILCFIFTIKPTKF